MPEEAQERARAARRRYRQRHPDRVLASHRRYLQSERGRRTHRAWVDANRAKVYAQNEASRRRCGLVSGDDWDDGYYALPALHTGNDVLLWARAIAGEPWYGRWLYRPEREDAASEAVVAILEGRDPAEASRRWLAGELAYHLTHLPLYASSYGQGWEQAC